MALDTFWVQDTTGGAFDRPDKLARLAVLFENVLGGKLDAAPGAEAPAGLPQPHPRLHSGAARADRQQGVDRAYGDRGQRPRPTGPAVRRDPRADRPGVQISSAKITTYGEKVVDVFYVKDIFGLKIEHESKIREIREALFHVLTEPDGEPAKPVTVVKAKLTA